MKNITTYREESYGFFLNSGDERLLGVNNKDGTVSLESDAGAGSLPADSIVYFEVQSRSMTCILGINTTSGFIPIGNVAYGDYTTATYWVTRVNILYPIHHWIRNNIQKKSS